MERADPLNPLTSQLSVEAAMALSFCPDLEVNLGYRMQEWGVIQNNFQNKFEYVIYSSLFLLSISKLSSQVPMVCKL